MLEIPFLRSLVGVALWDATVASAAYLIAIPLLALFASPLFLLLYVIDLPAIIVPAFFYFVNLGALENGTQAVVGPPYKAYLLPMAIAFSVTVAPSCSI